MNPEVQESDADRRVALDYNAAESVRAWSIICLGLLQAMLGHLAIASDGQSVVIVSMPADADGAMAEALHRLRGEATAVGFEVRLVSSVDERRTKAELERLWAEAKPAAVVTLALPDSRQPSGHALDVTFTEHPSGEVFVAHITAADVADQERAHVILAVRAVDFIRARMFDALVDRGTKTRQESPGGTVTVVTEARSGGAGEKRFHLAAGVLVLDARSGFGPSFVPRLVIAYRPRSWLRVGAVGFGFGTQASRQTSLGKVGLDQRFLGGDVALLPWRWRRMQPSFTLSAGELWAKLDGTASGNNVGRSLVRSSLAGAVSVGLTVDLGRGFAGEVFAGTLWLQNRIDIQTDAEDLGLLGNPTLFAGLMMSAGF